MAWANQAAVALGLGGRQLGCLGRVVGVRPGFRLSRLMRAVMGSSPDTRRLPVRSGVASMVWAASAFDLFPPVRLPESHPLLARVQRLTGRP